MGLVWTPTLGCGLKNRNFPQGLKATSTVRAWMYGLKPVPFKNFPFDGFFSNPLEKLSRMHEPPEKCEGERGGRQGQRSRVQ